MAGITITVDLAASSPAEIARAAKFMLEFAGYQDPSVAQSASNQLGQHVPDSYTSDTSARQAAIQQMLKGPMGSLGEEVHEPTTMPPPGMAFTQSSTAAVAPVGAVPPVPTAAPMHPEQPAVAVATLPPPPPGIEVDAQGVPWDNRIHAGSRAKIADGTWRQKRNLDPEVYKQVMDELRHTMGVERRAPQPPAPPAPQEVFFAHPPVPPVPVATPAPVIVDMDPAEPGADTTVIVPPAPFVASAVPPAPPISSTPPVPASAGAAAGASRGNPTFPDLMKRITAGFAGGTIKQPDIQRAVQKVGLTALPMLASRPDLVGDVATELGIAL